MKRNYVLTHSCLPPSATERILCGVLLRRWGGERHKEFDIYTVLSVLHHVWVEIIRKVHDLPYNLDQTKRDAIHSLKIHFNIVIKEADKDRAVLVMDKFNYIQKMRD